MNNFRAFGGLSVTLLMNLETLLVTLLMNLVKLLMTLLVTLLVNLVTSLGSQLIQEMGISYLGTTVGPNSLMNMEKEIYLWSIPKVRSTT